MSDEDDDVEWEYEDESDAGDAAEEPPLQEEQPRDALSPAHDGGAFQCSPGEEEEEEDVDWEDAAQPQDEPIASRDSLAADSGEDREDATELQEASEAIVRDLNAVNWDHINSVLQREAEKDAKAGDGKSAKRKPVRMTKQDREHELALHKSHLLVLLAAQVRANALCQSRVLRGLLLSLTSDSSLDLMKETTSRPLAHALELLVRWFHQHFRLTDHADAQADAVVSEATRLTENALLRALFSRHGSHAELALLFTALCRVLGLLTRLTVALDPLVVQQHSKATEAAVTKSATPRNKRKRLQVAREERESRAPSSQLAWMWSEVWSGKAKSWVMVDAVRKIVNRPQQMETLRGVGTLFSYVVSIEEGGFVADVTPRYVERWSKTMPRRLAHEWMMRSVQLINRQVDDAVGGNAQCERREAERAKLRLMTESEEMPTSVEGFKKHHLYCLERHLGQFECVYPRKAVGLFKGRAVYLRKNVQRVRAWFQWRRLGREVRGSERDRPAKRQGTKQKKPGVAASDSDDDGGGVAPRGGDGGGGGGRSLYGIWQTDEIVPLCLDGVIVPKNKYGNIELWSPAHLPIGAVHLQLPRIDKVAQQLGVDFAPAVVGFEARNGMNYPQVDGIVVAETVAETLLDAHAHFQQSMIEKAITKNQQLVVKRWERIMKRLLLKQRLNDEYGEV